MTSHFHSRSLLHVIIVSALCVMPLLWLVDYFWFVCDDAFISFRYSKHFAEGLGLRYNLGVNPPVEGYSNLLWVLLCAAGLRFGIEPDIFAPTLSTICGVFLVWRVTAYLFHHADIRKYAIALAALSLALSPPFALWCTGGLATMPYALLVFLCFEALFVNRSSGSAILFGALLILIRAEGFITALGLGFLALLLPIRDRGLKRNQLQHYLAGLCLVLACVTAWRIFYYGEFFPNTVTTKGEMSPERLTRGFQYVGVFGLTFPIFTFTTLLGLLELFRKVSTERIVIALISLAFPLYAIASGGDFMAMGRFLIPSLPFQALLLAFFIRDCSRAGSVLTAIGYAASTAIVALSFAPRWDWHAVPVGIRETLHFRKNTEQFRSETEQWQAMKDRSESWKAKGLALAVYAKPGDSLVAKAIGNIGYYSGLKIYDQFGLVSKEVAQLSPSLAPHSPGHDKVAPKSFFLDQEPTILYAQLIVGKNLKTIANKQIKKWGRAEPIPAGYGPDLMLTQRGAHPEGLLVIRRIVDSASAHTFEDTFKEIAGGSE